MNYADLIDAIERHLSGLHRDRPADTTHLIASATLAKLDPLATPEQRAQLAKQEQSLRRLAAIP